MRDSRKFKALKTVAQREKKQKEHQIRYEGKLSYLNHGRTTNGHSSLP